MPKSKEGAVVWRAKYFDKAGNFIGEEDVKPTMSILGKSKKQVKSPYWNGTKYIPLGSSAKVEEDNLLFISELARAQREKGYHGDKRIFLADKEKLDLLIEVAQSDKSQKTEVFRVLRAVDFDNDSMEAFMELLRTEIVTRDYKLEPLRKRVSQKKGFIETLKKSDFGPDTKAQLITKAESELQRTETKLQKAKSQAGTGKKVSPMEIAHSKGMSKERFERLLKNVTGVNFSGFKTQSFDRATLKVRVGEEDIASLIRGWRPVLGSKTFNHRIKYADPIISTEQKNYRKRLYPARTEPGSKIGFGYSSAMDIMGDKRLLQPIKRIRIVGHSYTQATKWANGEEFGFYAAEMAKTDRDMYLTHEGGIIIDETWAQKQKLGIGDKILGIYGLKGIVCEVRKMRRPMIVNRNQLWSDKKLSRMCGAGVLEWNNGEKLSVFTESSSNISHLAFRESQAKFAPDLLPFLAEYLSFSELQTALAEKATKFQDFMNMINFEFVEKEGHLELQPKLTQPDCSREGGKCKPWSHSIWAARDKQPYLSSTKDTRGNYPFIIDRLWEPEWLTGVCMDENDEPYREYKGFFTPPDKNISVGMLQRSIAKMMYDLIFSYIPNSVAGLIAYQKDGDPKEVILSKAVAKAKGWKDGDTALVYRSPVVSKLNIQKVKLRFEETPANTLGINIESLRLMFGDTDGDTLAVVPIEGGEAFIVSDEVLTAEREKIMEEVASSDTIEFPTKKEEIQVAMREAFIKMKYEDEDKQTAKLAIFRSKLPKLMKSNTIRTDKDLLDEARTAHDNLNRDQDRTTKAGGLTKKAWLATSGNEMVAAIAAIEQMKDRPKVGKQDDFADALDVLKGYIETIKVVSKKKTKEKDKEMLVLPFGIENFASFITKGTFKAESRKGLGLSDLRGKDLGRINNPYAKFIMALSVK